MTSFQTDQNLSFNSQQRNGYPIRKLASISCTATEKTLYECPSGRTCEVRHLHFASTHSGSEPVTLWHVRQSEATALSNALFYEYSLSAKAFLSEDAPIYLLPGERLIVKASAADRITVTVYGIET
jgi:hypothetical protein